MSQGDEALWVNAAAKNLVVTKLAERSLTLLIETCGVFGPAWKRQHDHWAVGKSAGGRRATNVLLDAAHDEHDRSRVHLAHSRCESRLASSTLFEPLTLLPRIGELQMIDRPEAQVIEVTPEGAKGVEEVCRWEILSACSNARFVAT